MAGSADVTGDIGGCSLETSLALAVPLWMGWLRGRHADELAAMAAEEETRLPLAAAALAGSCTAQASAWAASSLARALALAAQAASGVDFGGLHWCAAPHPDCPARHIPG